MHLNVLFPVLGVAAIALRVWLWDVSADGTGGSCLPNETSPASFVGASNLYFIPNWASYPYLHLYAEVPAYTSQYGFSHITSMRVRQL